MMESEHIIKCIRAELNIYCNEIQGQFDPYVRMAFVITMHEGFNQGQISELNANMYVNYILGTKLRI